MRVPLSFVALLGLSVAIGAEANLAMTPAPTQPGVAAAMGARAPRAIDAMPFASDAWWLGFRDDTLNVLILAAHRHGGSAAGAAATHTVAGDALALPIEMQVAAAYVSAKVDSIGVELIREAMAATRRQAELMRGGRLSDGDRAVLQRRMTDAMAAERTLVDRRATLLALLAARCGMDMTALEALVMPAGTVQPLPRFDARLPELPASDWVFERQDVVLAQALRAISAASHTRLDDGYVDSVIQRAEAEVSAAISELQEQRARTAALEARADAVRQALDDALARQQDGSGSELDVLERYQQFMLYSQQFSSASGTLALGWIKLLYRLQGALDSTADGSAWPASRPPSSHGTLQRPLI
jgi:hypothetical protein